MTFQASIYPNNVADKIENLLYSTLQSPQILDAVVGQPIYLLILFTPPKAPLSTDSVMSSFFARVVAHLMTHRGTELISWLRVSILPILLSVYASNAEIAHCKTTDASFLQQCEHGLCQIDSGSQYNLTEASANVDGLMPSYRLENLLELQENNGLLESLTDRLENTGIAESIVRLVGADQQTSGSLNPEQLSWVADTSLLPTLLQK